MSIEGVKEIHRQGYRNSFDELEALRRQIRRFMKDMTDTAAGQPFILRKAVYHNLEDILNG